MPVSSSEKREFVRELIASTKLPEGPPRPSIVGARARMEHVMSRAKLNGVDVSEAELLDLLMTRYGVPAINVAQRDIKPEILARVPRDMAEEFGAIPVNLAGDTLIVAIVDPTNADAKKALEKRTGLKVDLLFCASWHVEEAFLRCYG